MWTTEMIANENRYEKTTRGICVRVIPSFLPEQSSHLENKFVWAYEVEIINKSEKTVTLRDRYWSITNALGEMEEVRGAGVVGEQPVLQPGDSFEYTSGCPLNTPSGFMVGQYGMMTANGEMFQVDIPAFSLDLPGAAAKMN